MHALCSPQFSEKMNTTYSHFQCTHFAWISFASVHLYFISISRTVYTSALCKSTLTRTSLPSVLSANHRTASIYLLCSDCSIRRYLTMIHLNHSILTTSFQNGNERGKKTNASTKAKPREFSPIALSKVWVWPVQWSYI